MTQLATRRFELSINGLRHNVFRVRPEPGTPLEAIEDRGYWAHVSANLRPGDIVEIIPDDYSYFASYMVVDAGKLYATVKRKEFVDFASKAEAADVPDGYEVKHRGPKGWCVIRGQDVLAEKQGDKESALKWLENHLKAA